MKCRECGTEFSEGIFCPECGTKCREDAPIEEDYVDQKILIEKEKTEQERLAKERAEHEAEIIRQNNERMRIEQEIAEKSREDEKKRQEELARTFNGRLYASIEEMEIARNEFEKEEAARKEQKKADNQAILCLILGIATYPLVYTYVGWFPAIIASIVLGISAIKKKSKRKVCIITGLGLDILFFLIIIFAIVWAFFESGNKNENNEQKNVKKDNKLTEFIDDNVQITEENTAGENKKTIDNKDKGEKATTLGKNEKDKKTKDEEVNKDKNEKNEDENEASSQKLDLKGIKSERYISNDETMELYIDDHGEGNVEISVLSTESPEGFLMQWYPIVKDIPVRKKDGSYSLYFAENTAFSNKSDIVIEYIKKKYDKYFLDSNDVYIYDKEINFYFDGDYIYIRGDSVKNKKCVADEEWSIPTIRMEEISEDGPYTSEDRTTSIIIHGYGGWHAEIVTWNEDHSRYLSELSGYAERQDDGSYIVVDDKKGQKAKIYYDGECIHIVDFKNDDVKCTFDAKWFDQLTNSGENAWFEGLKSYDSDSADDALSVAEDKKNDRDDTIVITASDGYANVRSGPGTEYEIITTIENGETVDVVDGVEHEGSRKGWIEIEPWWTGEDDAWVAESQVTWLKNGYILPESDSGYYSESDLSHLNKEGLRYARNEIIARHGRRYTDEALSRYFNGRSWYHPYRDDIEDSDLNEYEKYNIDLIKSLEKR